MISLEKIRDSLEKCHLGLRTLKTALAVVLAASFAKYVLNVTPFFACIGAVAAMDSSIPRSFRSAIIRDLGTFAGGTIGILAGMMFHGAVDNNTVLLGIGVIPLIIFINLTKVHDSIVPGCVTFFATVFLNDASGTWSYGSVRILNTFVGTVIALAVNYLIFPPKMPITEPEIPHESLPIEAAQQDSPLNTTVRENLKPTSN